VPMPAYGDDLGEDITSDNDFDGDLPIATATSTSPTRSAASPTRRDSSSQIPARRDSQGPAAKPPSPRKANTDSEESSSDGEMDDEAYQRRLKQLQQKPAEKKENISPRGDGSGSSSSTGSGKEKKSRKARGVSVLNDDVHKEFTAAVDMAKGNTSPPLSPTQPQAQPQPQAQLPPQSAPQPSVSSGLQEVRLAPPEPSLDNLSPEEKKKVVFRRLCITNQGVILEDDVIQIGFKSEYHHGQVRFLPHFDFS